ADVSRGRATRRIASLGGRGPRYETRPAPPHRHDNKENRLSATAPEGGKVTPHGRLRALIGGRPPAASARLSLTRPPRGRRGGEDDTQEPHAAMDERERSVSPHCLVQTFVGKPRRAQGFAAIEATLGLQIEVAREVEESVLGTRALAVGGDVI